jgi:hypothetical protein
LKAFAEAWPEESMLQRHAAKLPWGRDVRLLDHVKDSLVMQIEQRQEGAGGRARPSQSGNADGDRGVPAPGDATSRVEREPADD